MMTPLFNRAHRRATTFGGLVQQPRAGFAIMEKTFLANDLQIIKREELKEKPDKDHVYAFGAVSTDYMLEVDFDLHNGGWQSPKIVPNEPFSIDPANATLHYSIECFEGSKAYRTVDDKIILFRSDENFRRMNQSHLQLGIPTFDRFEMLECCRKLIEIEKDWIPDKPSHSLYIRPTSICMDNKLGLSRVTKSKTYIILSPVGPYYPRGFVPVKLYCDTNVIRAWP